MFKLLENSLLLNIQIAETLLISKCSKCRKLIRKWILRLPKGCLSLNAQNAGKLLSVNAQNTGILWTMLVNSKEDSISPLEESSMLDKCSRNARNYKQCPKRSRNYKHTLKLLHKRFRIHQQISKKKKKIPAKSKNCSTDWKCSRDIS